MLNDKGQKIVEAPPSTPVEVVGFTDIPEAGEAFIVVSEEKMARPKIPMHEITMARIAKNPMVLAKRSSERYMESNHWS